MPKLFTDVAIKHFMIIQGRQQLSSGKRQFYPRPGYFYLESSPPFKAHYNYYEQPKQWQFITSNAAFQK